MTAPLHDPAVPTNDDVLHRWFAPPAVVRVLCYSDDPDVTFDRSNAYGLGWLRDLVDQRRRFYANVEFRSTFRHAPRHAAQRLTPELLAGFDELWIFGFRLCNREGEPGNELTDPEVAALTAWMRTGGVLITGDHANPRPPDAVAALPDLLGMGRAIGRRVPRAGLMRAWDGAPGIAMAASVNTQPVDVDGNAHDLALQEGARPQRLILSRAAVADGYQCQPCLRTRPHPIFRGPAGDIELFPVHMHEGSLATPHRASPEQWPDGAAPAIAASVVDQRFGSVHPAVSTYDGGAAGAGRIVADTSWHHYINTNLWGLRDRPELLELGDYYTNLALWLAPEARRQEMRRCLWWWLATHPTVRMLRRHPLAQVGLTANSVLRRTIGRVDLDDLLWPVASPLTLRRTHPLPSDELVLGAVVTGYLEAFQSARAGIRAAGPDELIADGVRLAVSMRAEDLARTHRATLELAGALDEAITPQSCRERAGTYVHSPPSDR